MFDMVIVLLNPNLLQVKMFFFLCADNCVAVCRPHGLG